jgi:FdhE protein
MSTATLPWALELHRAVLELAPTVAVVPLAPDVAVAAARLARGEPALSPGSLELDWDGVRVLACGICAVGARQHATLAPAFEELGAWLAEAPAEVLRRLARAHLGAARRDGVLGFVLTEALRPHLRAAAAALATVLAGAPPAPCCPACGGAPDLAALDAEAGARRLLCARCDTEWPWQRLGCPYCRNENAESLGYFQPGGPSAYRLYVCDRCRQYLKTVDQRETWQHRPLPVERVATSDLDLAALEWGYRR